MTTIPAPLTSACSPLSGQLNGIANEAVAKGQYEFLLQADELPHGDSWAIICKELVRNGFRTAEAMAEGIRVQIKS